jgi:hypothetical protein
VLKKKLDVSIILARNPFRKLILTTKVEGVLKKAYLGYKLETDGIGSGSRAVLDFRTTCDELSDSTS